MICRNCGKEVTLDFVDLGSSPPSNAYLTEQTINEPEKWFPLRIKVCTNCWLVQTEDYSKAHEIFTKNYAYFSSFSSTWLKHCKKYVDYIVTRFNLDSSSFVVEVASNDGYLLQYVKEKNIPCVGIEPTESTAEAAKKKKISTIVEFFGTKLAYMLAKDKKADFMIANNVLAHVPNIHDFVQGFSIMLKDEGVASFEFGYLMDLVRQTQFDIMYHEHYSYLSLTSVKNVMERHGLVIFDAEMLPTQGGSLRIYVCKKESEVHEVTDNVIDMLRIEKNRGIRTEEFYSGFQDRTSEIKNRFVTFLIEEHEKGKKIVGYGAAAKGNTLLNYAGVRKDLVLFIADKNPDKQGKYIPGCRIPIVGEDYIRDLKPDYIIIFPWNLKGEIMKQLSYVREWNAKFVIAVPKLEVL